MERHLSNGSGWVDILGRGSRQVIRKKQRLKKKGLVKAWKVAGKKFLRRTI
jgi:hypothetical protein